MPLDHEKIKRLRLQRGLNLKQASEAAGFKNRQSWQRIEAGGQPNIGLQLLERVAKTLGVRAKDLLK